MARQIARAFEAALYFILNPLPNSPVHREVPTVTDGHCFWHNRNGRLEKFSAYQD